MRFLALFSIALLLISSGCSRNDDRTDADISEINIAAVKIHRYDADLFRIDISDLSSSLKQIKNEYPFFLATNLDDPANIASMKEYLENPRNREFSEAVKAKYSDISGIERDLTEAFRHVKFYYPDFRIPRVYTYISGGDYDNPVSLNDSVILIALDDYLGKDYKPYLSDGIPVYKTERMIPEQIVPDCMRAVASVLFPENPDNMTLLEQMTEAGKREFLLKSFIPDIPGDIMMRYPKEQFEWAKENESHVWAAIIENKMLYSTEGRTLRTFLADGPFTPEFSKASPPRLGEWIGYGIVRSYMIENSDIQLPELLGEKDAQKILQHSGYKPEK